MSISLTLKRKTKALFLKYNLHRLTEPFSGALLNLAYLSKFSAWRQKNSKPAFNDFYSPAWDYTRRYKLYEFLLTNQSLNNPFNYLEFGVAEGFSFKWWVEHNTDSASRFYGFDTFTGLPEAWDQFKAGDMSVGGNFPKINDSRVEFVKGIFQDTLPAFLKNFNDSRRKLIHLDADLYTSTLYVMASLAPYLKDGDILMFDEFGVPTHEFLAYYNFQASFRINLELIGAANNYFFTAFVVRK
jgi:O-methyltransferase